MLVIEYTGRFSIILMPAERCFLAMPQRSATRVNAETMYSPTMTAE
jgi:hypothetical protein